MASMVLSSVGSYIGSAWGAWGSAIGGAIGSYAGSAIDRCIFGDCSKVNTRGPRLSDLSVQTSTEGASLPIVFGTMRLAGNVIWSTGLTEIATTEDQGGGSGGGGSSYTTYSYTTDCAVAICEGTITGIRRIWADTKLIYDVSETATVGTLVASSSYATGIRIYDGSETQLEDPLIQAVEGSAPAYRGTAYIVFEDLRLGDFGNRLPNFTFEVVKAGSASSPEFFYTNASPFIQSYHSRATISEGNNLHIFEVNNYKWYHYIFMLGTSQAILTESKTISTSGTLPSYDAEIHSYSDEYGLFSKNSFSTSTVTYIGYNNSLFTENTINVAPVTYPYFAVKKGNYFLVTGLNSSFKIAASLNGVHLSTLPTNIPEDGYKPLSGITDSFIFITSYGTNRVYRLNLAGTYIDYISIPANHYILKFISDTTCYSSTISGGTTTIYLIDFSNPSSLVVTPVTTSTNLRSLNSNRLNSLFVINSKLLGFYCSDYGSISEVLIKYVDTTVAKTTQNLQTICEQIVVESLLEASQYDFSALSDIEVRGYTISKVMSIKTSLDSLMSAYNFELFEEDNKIIARKLLSSTIDKVLIQDNLGAESYV